MSNDETQNKKINAFNYIIDKREPSAEHRAALDGILHPGEMPTKPTVIPLPGTMDGYIVLDALTANECDEIIRCCEAIKFTFWSDPSAGDEKKTAAATNNNDNSNGTTPRISISIPV